jgi:hypothetical protein
MTMPPRGAAGGLPACGGLLGLALAEVLGDGVLAGCELAEDGELVPGDGFGDAAEACAAQGSSSTPDAMKTAPASAPARRRQPTFVALVRIRFLYPGG